MRTKTTILSAVALAAGLLSAGAQVYSANVVGYYNVTIPGGNKYALLANQLINGSDANKTNNDIQVSVASGLVSSDDPFSTHGTNSQYVEWNGFGYNTYYYFNAADAGVYGTTTAGPGWFDGGGTAASVSLNQGISAFLKNASSNAITVTIVGTVRQGTGNLGTIKTNTHLYALGEPIGTNADNTAGFGLPIASLTSSADPFSPAGGNNNDTYYQWNGVGYNTFYWFNAADAVTYGTATAGPGFFDSGGTRLDSTQTPQVGQGFLLKHIGANIPWNISFTVQ